MDPLQIKPYEGSGGLIARHLSPLLRESLGDTPAVLINGPRWWCYSAALCTVCRVDI